MIQGAPKFDGIAVGSLEAMLIGPNKTLKAKAAFVNSKSSATHGWTEKSSWSPAVFAKLKELTELMESELALDHFEGATAMGVPSAKKGVEFEEAGGLGEHLRNGDAPSI